MATDLTSVTPDEFRTAVTPLATAASTAGTVWARPLTYAYLASIVLIFAAAIYLCFPLEGFWPFAVWAVALVLIGWLAQRRSWVARRAFDTMVFKGKRLSDMHTKVDHVITACDLQTVEQVYFSGRFVYSYRHGWGTPGDLKIAWAAQASACLPGAFTPVSRAASKHGFTSPRPEAPARFLLVDGGVYDNMGTEWPIRLADRIEDGTPPSPLPRVPDVVIVVNASAAMGVVSRKSVHTPWLGELTALLANKDVLYDQTTAVRRRLLDARFRAHRRGDPRSTYDGTMVQIDRSPFALPRQFEEGTSAEAQRARAVIAKLDPATEAAWAQDAHASRSVGTALSKIDPDRAARLMRHAYVLTMANSVVLLDFPLLDVPDVAFFRRMVEKS
jgi:predicted acylesterase/phospholipase RssA